MCFIEQQDNIMQYVNMTRRCIRCPNITPIERFIRNGVYHSTCNFCNGEEIQDSYNSEGIFLYHCGICDQNLPITKYEVKATTNEPYNENKYYSDELSEACINCCLKYKKKECISCSAYNANHKYFRDILFSTD